MYKVCLYRKEKLLPVLSNKGFETKEAILDILLYWFDVKRNDQSSQFIIINIDEDRVEGVLDLKDVINHRNEKEKNGSSK